MRKLLAIVGVAFTLAWAGAAVAADLTPSLAQPLGGGTGSVAGEGAAPNAFIIAGLAPNTAVLHLDWIVFRVPQLAALGGFLYLYQLENSSVFDLTSLTISSKNFTGAGVLPGKSVPGGSPDLDSDADMTAIVGSKVTLTTPANTKVDIFIPGQVAAKGHNEVTYPNLATTDVDGDHEVASDDCCVGPDGAAANLTNANANWTLNNLLVGQESGILVATGKAPVYVDWNSSGSAGFAIWSNQALNPTGEAGRQVAAPGTETAVPEPASLLLLGFGTLGLGMVVRRRLGRK